MVSGEKTSVGEVTFVVPERPNFSASVIPQTQHLLSVGRYQPGRILSLAPILDTKEVRFPESVSSNMHAILNASNLWQIPTPDQFEQKS